MNDLKATLSDDQTGRAEKSTRPRLGCERTTFGLLVRCSHQLSYEVRLGEVAERWYNSLYCDVSNEERRFKWICQIFSSALC